MVVFFVLSSAISVGAGRARATEIESRFEKGLARDATQVLANGGVGGVLVILWSWLGGDQIYVAYLGSVAAAAADTWATEIGSITAPAPRLITTWKTVEHGRSGAVSPSGFVAALMGAGSVACGGYVWLDSGAALAGLLSAIFGGVLGCAMDSVAGATIQASYRCPACGGITERGAHCGVRTVKRGGYGWVSNDAVNLICTSSGGFLSFVLFTVLKIV